MGDVARLLFVMDPATATAYAWLPLAEHAAIFVAGASHLPTYPAPLGEMR